MGVMMVMVMAGVRAGRRGIFPAHAELRGRYARALHPFGPDGRSVEREAAQRCPDALQLDTEIDERPKDHVSRGTGEAIEVEDLHGPIILPEGRGRPPASLSE